MTTKYIVTIGLFSPPCGDGMTLFEEKVNEYRFSSPYGDKLRFWQFSGTWEPIPGFRPLTGMVHELFMVRNEGRVFAPLRGWYAKNRKRYYYEKAFAPLRGWYYVTDQG